MPGSLHIPDKSFQVDPLGICFLGALKNYIYLL